MKLLSRDEVRARLTSKGVPKLHLDPLLDDQQIGPVSADLRLGTDFLVSILTRTPSIDIYPSRPAAGTNTRDVTAFFRSTRRDLGDRFAVYPGQVVLATTLEYVALPSDMYAEVNTRSSVSRLGIQFQAFIQPGFRGCFPLEITNHGNSPVELIVGGRLVQARFFGLDEAFPYQDGATDRKYMGNVRPTPSKAQRDGDLARLHKMTT